MDLKRRTLGLVATGAVLAGCGAATGTAAERRAREAAGLIRLPAARANGTMSVEQAIADRRSVRSFTAEPMSLGQIGQLLWAAQGITHAGDRRAAPSGGALYPLELYAVTRSSIVHYLPAGHRARVWTVPGTWQRLIESTPSQEAVAGAATAFVVTAVVRRTSAKYGGRAPFYVLLEAGHAVENLWLQAVALGLGAVTIGAVNEQRLGRMLTLPIAERAQYLVAVGTPAPGA